MLYISSENIASGRLGAVFDPFFPNGIFGCPRDIEVAVTFCDFNGASGPMG